MTTDDDTVAFEQLRHPDPRDLEQIVRLEEESFSNPWTAEGLAEMLKAPVTQLHVARVSSHEIVGFCACWVIEGELHINTVAVKQPWRHLGIATRLLRHVLESTGVNRATLEVRRSNVAALKLYEGLGFRTTAVRPRYYSNPEEDALILWLNP